MMFKMVLGSTVLFAAVAFRCGETRRLKVQVQLYCTRGLTPEMQ